MAAKRRKKRKYSDKGLDHFMHYNGQIMARGPLLALKKLKRNAITEGEILPIAEMAEWKKNQANKQETS